MNRGFGGDGSISPLIFLRGMKEAKAKFDIASLHPYPVTGRAGLQRRHPGAEHHAVQHRRLLEGARQALAGQALPVWLTEYGQQSKPDRYGATLTARPTFVNAMR